MSLDDDHHEHEYERSFGAIEGNLLERAKSIGSGPASRTWTGLGRRKSLQDNNQGETPHDLSNDRDVAMKPRRVSFGWSGFAKPAAPTPTPANKTKMPGSPGQVDGLPQKPQQEGLRVGRGRSGSTGQEGKKRSVSPVSRMQARMSWRGGTFPDNAILDRWESISCGAAVTSNGLYVQGTPARSFFECSAGHPGLALTSFTYSAPTRTTTTTNWYGSRTRYYK